MWSKPIVLVVEDEPLTLLAACIMVEDAGLIPREAANAECALQIFALQIFALQIPECDPSIGILFTDIDLAGSMDGMALAYFVQRWWPRIGLIITSGRWLNRKFRPAPCSSKSRITKF